VAFLLPALEAFAARSVTHSTQPNGEAAKLGLSFVHCLNDACVLGCHGSFHVFPQTLQGTIQYHILHHSVTNINTVMYGTTVRAVDLQWLDFGALELGLPGRVELRLLIVRTRRKGT